MKVFVFKYKDYLDGFDTYEEFKTKFNELEKVIFYSNKSASFNYNLLNSFRENYYNGFLKKIHKEMHEYVYYIYC